VCPWRAAVAMGENMSKRLKLVSGSESAMEERSFPNPFPDWDPGLLLSPQAGEHEPEPAELFDATGKVCVSFNACLW